MARHSYQNTKALSYQARSWKLKLTTQEVWIPFFRVQGKTSYEGPFITTYAKIHLKVYELHFLIYLTLG